MHSSVHIKLHILYVIRYKTSLEIRHCYVIL